jgi:hypothetical protein
MTTTPKITIFVNFLRLTLLIAAIIAVGYSSWTNLSLAIVTLLLSFSPAWFERYYHIDIPLDFELLIILFIYASLFLGETGRFYDRFWWWDLLLHAGSAVAFACIGFMILLALMEIRQVKTRPFWLAAFSFCFAISIGAMWEIYEFGMDQLLGWNMQKTGLMDTMWDLIINAIGGFLAASAGYAYLKGGRGSLVGSLIDRFFQSNPRLQ